ncbi:hypothetical protein ACPFP2_12545 [Micromonospora citrea]|uniref:hypothetical protein n=1 Tax=Micromonospora citrea TaxID=47855 RepID=UPI003C372A99
MRRIAMLAIVPLVGGGGLFVPTAAAAPVVARVAEAGSELHVGGTGCVPDGDGSEDKPFCTISAAAAVVRPGQTVLVQPGVYPEAVRLTRSGTEGSPITFRAVNISTGIVRVGRFAGADVDGSIVTFAQVHDVVVDGFTLYGGGGAPGVLVDGSSRVTLDNAAVNQGLGAAVQVTGGSRDVTVSRNWLVAPASVALAVEAGTTGVTVVANQVPVGRMVLTDTPGATVTNNTVRAACGPGIELAGTSPGASVTNNIVQPLADESPCTLPVSRQAVSVSAASTPDTVADHNLLDPSTGWAPYAWAGATHATLDGFRAATGQGAHDIAADPQLVDPVGGDRGFLPIKQTSPAVDSADATARGVPATDMLGNPHFDNPDRPDTGTGVGYHDRGAMESFSSMGSRWSPLRRTVGGGPLDATSVITLVYPWRADGVGGHFAYRFSDSNLWRVSRSPQETHRFRRAGNACVDRQYSYTGFRTAGGGSDRSCTVLGAHYTAVPPTRLLDTRAAIGVATTTPVPANSEVVLTVDDVGGVPAPLISAVVLNVTVTQPTASGFLTVYPDGTPRPSSSNVNFVAEETVPNLVTVPMTNGRIRIRNSGSGTVHVIADLQGHYSAAGQGFSARTPERVLDTRVSGGAFAPQTTRQLDLGHRVAPGTTAVVLNVTVTGPTANGVLKVFPYGQAVPTASNLNFVTGQTIPNLVVVPVVDGKVNIHNQSSGSTHVVADLAGSFGPDAQLGYVPNGPKRIIDTRDGTGVPGAAPLQPRQSIEVFPDVKGWPCCVTVEALVANLTVTAPTAPGVLIAHPADEDRPTVSNVNFVAGETASNLAVVRNSPGGLRLHNSSSGTVHTIVDQAGVFIAPQY